MISVNVTANTIVMLISCLMIVIVALQKPCREQKLTLLFSFLVAVVNIGTWAEVVAKSEGDLYTGVAIVHMAVPFIYYVLLLLVESYSKVKVIAPIKAGLIMVGTFLSLLAISNRYHKLLFVVDEPGFYGGKFVYTRAVGRLYPLIVIEACIYVICVVIVTVIGIIRTCKTCKKKRARHEIMVLLSMMFSVMLPCLSFFITKMLGITTEIISNVLVISEILYLVLMYTFKVYDVMDAAREYAYNNIDEGFISLDEKRRFLGANDVAADLIHSLADVCVGDSVTDIFPEMEYTLDSNKIRELYLGSKIIRMTDTEVMKKDKVRGYVIRLKDITAEVESIEVFEKYKKQLEYEVAEKCRKYQNLKEYMVLGFCCFDAENAGLNGSHLKRVSGYLRVLLTNLSKNRVFEDALTPFAIGNIQCAAPLHDIGKREFSAENSDQMAMRRHTVDGVKLIERYFERIEDYDFEKAAKDMALSHHEKWDGTGYPNGLKGAQIPLSARVLAVVNDFDNIQSAMGQKSEESFDGAYDIIKAQSGKAYDPAIVEVFLASKPEMRETKKRYQVEREFSL